MICEDGMPRKRLIEFDTFIGSNGVKGDDGGVLASWDRSLTGTSGKRRVAVPCAIRHQLPVSRLAFERR
jgi:hypothetical protein